MTLRGGLIAIASSVLVGCGANVPDVITLMAHGDCKRLNEGVSEIQFEDLAGIRGSQLLELEDAASMPAPPADPAPPPEPDFRLIAVSAGARPTPGYALELSGARFDSGVMVLTIALNEPPVDTRLAQVISHPCLIVATSHRRVPIEVRNAEGPLGSLPPIQTTSP
jgi:hypothetical protein